MSYLGHEEMVRSQMYSFGTRPRRVQDVAGSGSGRVLVGRCANADRGLVRHDRVRSVRIAIDFVLVAGVLVPAVVVLGIGAKGSTWLT